MNTIISFSTRCIFILLLICSTGKIKAQTSNCENDSTGLIPLNDLGAGFYEGFQGGLFPFGSNAENPASTHYKKGKTYAKNIKPLDTLGNINYEDGRIVMGGFGPSIPGQLMTQFLGFVRDTLDTEFKTNPCFAALNLCVGGKGLDAAIGATRATYWETIVEEIEEKHYSPLQVQVGWMYFNDKYDSLAPEPTFPESPEAVTDRLVLFLQYMMDYFPNMKIVFVSGRHYGGFADTLNEQYSAIAEPSSYWNNFSVKWLIERQINGDPALKYFGAGIRTPFVTWGPYYWADGNIPRTTDGRLYTCDDFGPLDGYHLSNPAYIDDAHYLMSSMYTSVFSKNYVKDGLAWTACGAEPEEPLKPEEMQVSINPNGLTLYPNPANENLFIYRHNATGKLNQIEIYDALGQLKYFENAGGCSNNNISIDISNLVPGIYTLQTKIESSENGAITFLQEQFVKI